MLIAIDLAANGFLGRLATLPGIATLVELRIKDALMDNMPQAIGALVQAQMQSALSSLPTHIAVRQ